MICGDELHYAQNQQTRKCSICSRDFSSNVACRKGHYVCDVCHALGAMDIIEYYSLNNRELPPLPLAVHIMQNHKIKMHGPEHHFLVPAVLLNAYYRAINKIELLADKIKIARKRAEIVPGGFCGFYGNCGAAVGTGITVSIITAATPLSINEWKLANLMTAQSLLKIAENGGPRCCKRDSFIAIKEGIAFIRRHLGVAIEDGNVACRFSAMNKECRADHCVFYPN
jgi:hypothetical protein